MWNGLRGCVRTHLGPTPKCRGESAIHGRLGWISSSRHTLTPADSEILSLHKGEDGVCCGVYGDIFNLPELMQDISPALSPLKTRAEVVWALYNSLGNELWPALDGSFIIALQNQMKGIFCIVNDRFASIPAYYSHDNAGFAFSTNFDEAAELSPCNLHLDEISVFNFITYQRCFGSATFFEEIRFLPPSSCLTFWEGKTAVTSYFTPCYASKQRPMSEWSHDLASAWKESVTRCTGDFPVLLLSGGYDSRAVIAASPGLPSAIFADYENNEVAIARKVAAAMDSSLLLLMRHPDHYTRLLQEGVSIGGGMYPSHMTHVPGFWDALAGLGPAVIHGNPPEAYFRNSSLSPSLASHFSKRRGKVSAEDLAGYFRVYAKYGMRKTSPRELLTDQAYKRFPEQEVRVLPLFREAEAHCESPHDMFMWTDTRHMSRYPSYAFELAIASALPKRTPMWDNTLYDLHLKMPWEVRQGDTLWLEMIRHLNPKAVEIASANKRVLPMHMLPVMAQNAIIHGLKITQNLGILPKALPSDPAHTMGSWPNFDELIRCRETLRSLFGQILASENGLPQTLFDHRKVMKRLDLHMQGKCNHSNLLFALVTFSLWHQQNVLGKGNEDNRAAWRHE